jgi:hypothetical protein
MLSPVYYLTKTVLENLVLHFSLFFAVVVALSVRFTETKVAGSKARMSEYLEFKLKSY